MTQKEQILNKLEDRLKGAKFRILNEVLYRKKDKSIGSELFKKYHEGYEEQTKKWPFNPVTRIIKQVAKMDRNLVIADLGCGTAELAKKLPKHTILSYDAVKPEGENDVVEVDIRSLPLANESVDVAICCLSLMSENVSAYVAEVFRILKPGGIFKIVEIRSRLLKITGFTTPMAAHGFSLLAKDLESNYFCFFDFKKTKRKMTSLPPITLKPCVYKKR